MKTFSITKKGRNKSVNQDCFLCEEKAVGNLLNLFIVADGMGGYNGGDFASKFCIENVRNYIAGSNDTSIISSISGAIKTANTDMRERTKPDDDLRGCGTTLVLATIKNNTLYVANVGDSRLYVLKKGKIKQVTEDHSLVEELVKRGMLKKEEARFHPEKNKVTRALGAEPNVEIDFFEVDLEKGDKVFLCSDGISNMIDESVIESIVKSSDDLAEISKKLVDTALLNGGKDDLTVVMVEV